VAAVVPSGAPLEAVVVAAEQLTLGQGVGGGSGGGGGASAADDATGDGGRLGRLHGVLMSAADKAALVAALETCVDAEHAADAEAAGGEAALTPGLLTYGDGRCGEGRGAPADGAGGPEDLLVRPVAVIEGLSAAHLLRGRLLLRHHRTAEAVDALSAALVRLEHGIAALVVAWPPPPPTANPSPTTVYDVPVHPTLSLQAVFTLTALGAA